MTLKKILFPIGFLILFSGCGTNKKLILSEILSSKEDYQQIAYKKYGEDAECHLNPNQSFVLCLKSDAQLNPNQLIKFFVYDIQQQEIIYEGKIANARISWHNNTQLLVLKQKGYITNPTDRGNWTYVFDLLTKKKMRLINSRKNTY